MTQDVGKIMSKLHQVKPNGCIDLVRGIKVANVTILRQYNKLLIVFLLNRKTLKHKARIEASSK